MTYEKWLAQVPASLKNDPIWKFDAYPKGLLLFDLVWEDSEQLMRDLRGREIARQLLSPCHCEERFLRRSNPHARRGDCFVTPLRSDPRNDRGRPSSYIARQLIRSAGSITANIDEGFGSHSSFLISHF